MATWWLRHSHYLGSLKPPTRNQSFLSSEIHDMWYCLPIILVTNHQLQVQHLGENSTRKSRCGPNPNCCEIRYKQCTLAITALVKTTQVEAPEKCIKCILSGETIEWDPEKRGDDDFLGGGNFKYFCWCSSLFGEDEPILTSIFFKGVETTNQFLVCFWWTEFES